MQPDFCLSLSLVCCLAAPERKTILVRSVVFRHLPALGFSIALEALPCEAAKSGSWWSGMPRL